MNKFKFLRKESISKLPKSTGVYVLKRGREFLYIGKATNIKERIKSHFKQPGYRHNLFINKVKRVGFIKTDSEIEALIVEANLIKKHQPRYNIVWRDDKKFFYVGITKEDYPRIFWTHQPQQQGRNDKRQKKQLTKDKERTKFVGPFVEGRALKLTLKSLRKVFPYRACKTLPKKPCLWYQLGRCPAPCLLKSRLAKEINLKIKIKKECQKNAKNLLKILKGKKKEVLKDLKREMKKASKIEDFEKAAEIRDQVQALEKILSHARVFEGIKIKESNWKKIEKALKKILKTKKKILRIEAYDVSNIQGQKATGSMITFIKGEPEKNFYRRFRIKISGKPNDLAMIREVLERRQKHLEWGLPDLILIDGGKAHLNTAINCLKTQFKNIKVIALAKKKNKLHLQGQKELISLKTLSREIFNLILQLRDEAHRFAINYHKELRTRGLLN